MNYIIIILNSFKENRFFVVGFPTYFIIHYGVFTMSTIFKTLVLSSIAASSLFSAEIQPLSSQPSHCSLSDSQAKTSVFFVIAQGSVLGGPLGLAYSLGMLSLIDNLSSDCSYSNKTEVLNNNKTSVLNNNKTEVLNNNKTEVFNNKKLSFDHVALFDFNSSKIKSIDIGSINLSDPLLKTIKVYGHADNIGSENYNFQLGLKRAIEFKKYIRLNNFTPSTTIISTGSFGKTKNKGIVNHDLQRRISLELIY
jgi:outer membrane protein OmpA-like peptidoglycan-associated protein